MDFKYLPEWRTQKGTVLIFPKRDSDWNCCFDEVEKDFKDFVQEITRFQKVFLISAENLNWKFDNLEIVYGVDYNDTWGRDSLGLVVSNGQTENIINYDFNAWGGKFDSTLDKQISKRLQEIGFWSNLIDIDYTIEGGAIETDGETLLITETSVLNQNRPKNRNRDEVEKSLRKNLGIEHIVWLKESFLKGDDTDGHIDMLARFSKLGEILYSLPKIGEELKDKFPHHNLIQLPNPNFGDFPATYLNFIFVNGGLLFPTYGVPEDIEAEIIFKYVFPNLEIVPINSRNFIRQGGSLHCLTMQL